MLTWHHHFQSPQSHTLALNQSQPAPSDGPCLDHSCRRTCCSKRWERTTATDPWEKKGAGPGEKHLNPTTDKQQQINNNSWMIEHEQQQINKQHFYSGLIASKSKDYIWHMLRPFKPKWISMYSVNGLYMPNIVSGMLSSILLYYTIVSEIQLQWVCNYKV